MVSDAADPVLGLPQLVPLDTDSSVQNMVPCQPDDVVSIWTRHGRALDRLTENRPEVRTERAKLCGGRKRQVDLKALREKEGAIDGGARPKVKWCRAPSTWYMNSLQSPRTSSSAISAATPKKRSTSDHRSSAPREAEPVIAAPVTRLSPCARSSKRALTWSRSASVNIGHTTNLSNPLDGFCRIFVETNRRHVLTHLWLSLPLLLQASI
jgi:hypothetical protein